MSGTDRRVAVIIPAYNAQGTIARAVKSALEQPETAQVVVVDDGSSDATEARARACDDGTGRLIVHRLPVSGGPARARNLALGMTDAAWVTPLDADDFMRPGRLGRLLDQADGCDLIADDLLTVREGFEAGPLKRMIGTSVELPLQLSFCAFVDANISRPRRARREYGFLKPLIRRDFLRRNRLAYADLRLGEDFVLYAHALALGARFKVVAACGYVAVQREGSLSHSHSAEDLRRLLTACEDLTHEIRLLPREAIVARRHQRHLQEKIDLRDVLDARRRRGLVAAAQMMVSRVHSAPYMLRQKLAARRPRHRAPKASSPEAVSARGQIRTLT